tara:strand:+ start:28 stop:357 length:330 start_codon:yes stop_codon:yes gene_type:complete
MEKLKINLLVGLFLVFSNFIFAQSEVSGNISDSEGNPIPGVTIIIDGTTNGTTSDFDGNYSISVSSDQSLQFSSLGFSITRNSLFLGAKTNSKNRILQFKPKNTSCGIV